MIAVARQIPLAPIVTLASRVAELLVGPSVEHAPEAGTSRASALTAATDAAAAAAEEFRAAFGGGMASMTPDDREIYERLCAVHSELRRRGAGVPCAVVPDTQPLTPTTCSP